MEDETEEGRGRFQNVFEQNAIREHGTKTVPIRMGEKIVGDAELTIDEDGVHIGFTNITDPEAREMLSSFSTDPSYISRTSSSEEK